MEYKGKLYGKVGKSYFPLLHTSDDYDNLVKRVAELEALIEQKLNKHGVMQAEGSDGENGAAVASEGQGEANTCADAGCPKCKSTNLFDVDDHWTKCDDCGFTFVG